MGLDQYAYFTEPNTKSDEGTEAFVWRKHAKLQSFMEDLFVTKTGCSVTDLNCGELSLNNEDIDVLERAVTEGSLPVSHGGFFYGHEMQDEQAKSYRDYDLLFCAQAREALNDGLCVIYSCWW